MELKFSLVNGHIELQKLLKIYSDKCQEYVYFLQGHRILLPIMSSSTGMLFKNNSKNSTGSFPIMFGIIPGISENGTGFI
ncbi:hypothetical protein EMCRGX_G012382 [Ephydatia muelleri]